MAQLEEIASMRRSTGDLTKKVFVESYFHLKILEGVECLGINSAKRLILTNYNDRLHILMSL